MRLLYLGRNVDTDTATSTTYIKVRDELSSAFDNGTVTPEELLEFCSKSDYEVFLQGLDVLEVEQAYLLERIYSDGVTDGSK